MSDAELEVEFPDELRKKYFEDLDWRYFIILFISLVLWTSGVTIANSKIDFPEPILIEEEIERIAQLVIPEVPETEVELEDVETEAAPGEGTPSEEDASKKPKTAVEAKAQADQRRVARATSAAVRRSAAQKRAGNILKGTGVLAIIGTRSSSGVVSTGGTGAIDASELSGAAEISADVKGIKRVTTGSGAVKKAIRKQIASGGDIYSALAGLTGDIVASSADPVTLSGGGIEIEIAGPTDVPAGAQTLPGRDVAAVNSVVTQNLRMIINCYENGLKRNPSLQGRVEVEFVVRTNGRVTDVDIVSSSLRDSQVERCITRNVRRWRFSPVDESTGDQTYRYPFIFRPQ